MGKIKKPKLQSRKAYEYSDCAKWVEQKLGYDIRNTLGNRSPEGFKERREYRDWWHFIIDYLDVRNGCYISIEKDLLENGNNWQNEITQAFIDEFGEDAEYWVWW